MKHVLELNINGDPYEVIAAPNETLLEVLRDRLGLMGTKRGCDLGACGSCTVILDGEAVLSCVLLAVDAAGKKIMTIEGLTDSGELHPLQKSFMELGGLQCGFCTPGMILTAKSVLDETPHPTEDEIRRKMGGNLCRCTGYKKVVEAVVDAAESMGKGD